MVGDKRLLVRFKYGFDKGLISNKLTVLKKDRSNDNEEAEEVVILSKIFIGWILTKGLYQEVYAIQLF